MAPDEETLKMGLVVATEKSEPGELVPTPTLRPVTYTPAEEDDHDRLLRIYFKFCITLPEELAVVVEESNVPTTES